MKVEDKSNEITAIPGLLELLDIAGSIITIDAIGTQTEIAKKIIDKKADYVLTLKANHPTLHSQVQEWFETARANNFSGIDFSYDKRIEKAHHRMEIRSCLDCTSCSYSSALSTQIMGRLEKPCYDYPRASSLEQNYS